MVAKAKGKPKKSANSNKKTAPVVKKSNIGSAIIEEVPAMFHELSSEEKKHFIHRFCKELVSWLLGQQFIEVGHTSMDYDIVVESQNEIRPRLYDLKARYLDKGLVKNGIPFDYITENPQPGSKYPNSTFTVQTYNPIPLEVFVQGDFNKEDFNKYSYYHYYPLKTLLEIVVDYFSTFTFYLNRELQFIYSSPYTNENYHRRTIVNLQHVLKLLADERNGSRGIRIPDIFERDISQVTLSSDATIFPGHQQKNRKNPPRIWTSMYSFKTSEAFSTLLSEIIKKKLKVAQFEIGEFKSIELEESPSRIMNMKEWLAMMPEAETPERITAALRIIGITQEDPLIKEKAKRKLGELMLIFRALEQTEIILKDVPANNKAVAFQLLTGLSGKRYSNKHGLMVSPKIDFDELFDNKNVQANKANANSLALALKATLDKLIAELK